jgi:hypothetical protein
LFSNKKKRSQRLIFTSYVFGSSIELLLHEFIQRIACHIKILVRKFDKKNKNMHIGKSKLGSITFKANCGKWKMETEWNWIIRCMVNLHSQDTKKPSRFGICRHINKIKNLNPIKRAKFKNQIFVFLQLTITVKHFIFCFSSICNITHLFRKQNWLKT